MSSPSSSDAVVIDAAFQAEAFEAFAMNVPGAHVSLRPHDEEDEVQVRGFVPDADAETAQTLFDRKRISTHQSGDQLHLLGDALSTGVEDWRWRHNHDTAVHFEVRLPPSLNVTTTTPGGAVDAANLTGRLDITLMGGSVRVSGLSGPLEVQGGGGSLSVQNCGGAALSLQWSGGTVSLETLSPTDMTLWAASAPTTVRALHGPAECVVHGAPLTLRDIEGPCDAVVQGGALTYYGAPTEDTSLRAVGGPLRTHLPPSHAATLTLTGARVGLDDGFAFDGERTARRIEGRLNGGGPSLQLRAVQGTARCSVMRD